MRAMSRRHATWILLVFTLGCRAGGPVAERSQGTVRALRYERRAFESMLEFLHDDGTWYEDLYFPERGIRATLARTSWWDEREHKFKYKSRLVASYGPISNKFSVSPGAEETEQPTEEVRVAVDLANRIFALAELHKRIDEEQELLGGLTEKAGVLHMKVGSPQEQE